MSEVLDRVRKQYPAYAKVDDAKLAEAIGDKYPSYLERDAQFKTEWTQAKANKANQGFGGAVTVTPDDNLRRAAEDYWATQQGQPVIRSFPPTPLGPDEELVDGKVVKLNYPEPPEPPADFRDPFTRVNRGGQVYQHEPSAEEREHYRRDQMMTMPGGNPDVSIAPIGTWLRKTGEIQLGGEVKEDPALEGAAESVEETLNSLTTPRNISYLVASVGVGSTSTTAARMVAALWTTIMGKEAVQAVPEWATELGNEMGKPPEERDRKKIGRILADSGTLTVFTVAPAMHIVGKPAAVELARRFDKATQDAEFLKGATAEGAYTYEHTLQGERVSGPGQYLHLRAGQGLQEPEIEGGREGGREGTTLPTEPPGPGPRPQFPRPQVPETPAEPERDLNVIQEIRAKGARTIRQIQELFPGRGLSREEARVFRNQAWPTGVAKGEGELNPVATPGQTPSGPAGGGGTGPGAAQQVVTVRGAAWQATTPVEGVKVAGQYGLAEADDLLTSFDPGYEQALQGRDRNRAASANQIMEIARRFQPHRLGQAPTTDLGAPLIDERGQVISGNGRTSALRLVYDSEQQAQYTAWLREHAAEFGLKPEDVDKLGRPVLVREVTDYGGLDKVELARQSNQQQVLGMSDAEKAGNDARMLAQARGLMESFVPGEDGNVLAASNRGFLNAFIQGTGDQAAFLNKDGSYNAPVLAKRVRNAILAALLGPEHPVLLRQMVEGAEELGIKRAVDGVMSAAPGLMKFRGTAYDLAGPLQQAFSDLARIRASGEKLQDFLASNELLGSTRTVVSDMLLEHLHDTRSAGATRDALNRYAQQANEALQDQQSGGMFGPPATQEQIVRQVYGPEEPPTQTGTPSGGPQRGPQRPSSPPKGPVDRPPGGQGAGSKTSGPASGAPESSPGATGTSEPARAAEVTEASLELREGDEPLFGSPESVQEQKARLKREAEAARKKAQQEELAKRAAKPLEGKRGDIGQKDLFGGGDLFSETTDPVDKATKEGLVSQYGASPEQVEAVFKAPPYQQSELFGQPAKKLPNPGAGRLSDEEARQALTTLAPEALQTALSKSRKVSSIRPEKAPDQIPTFDIRGQVIRTPADFARTLVALRSPYNESLKIAIIDNQGTVIHSQVLYAGTIDTMVIAGADFVRLQRKYGKRGTKMVVSHNHPSGDVSPSGADLEAHKRIRSLARSAGFEILDHVITNGDDYYSLERRTEYRLDPANLAVWERAPRRELQTIATPKAFERLVMSLRQGANPNVAHIIYQTTRATVTAIERVPLPSTQSDVAITLQRAILRNAPVEGARYVLIDYGPEFSAPNAYQVTSDISYSLMYGSAHISIEDYSAQFLPSARVVGLIQQIAKGLGFEKEKDYDTIKTDRTELTLRERDQAEAGAGPANAQLRQATPTGARWFVGVRRVWAPQTVDEAAAIMGGIIRSALGREYEQQRQADFALKQWQKLFDRTPVPRGWEYVQGQRLPHNYEVMRAIDTGELEGLTNFEREFVTQIRGMFDEAIEQVQEVSPNSLRELIENYFPRIWRDPEKNAEAINRLLSRRPWEGPKSFLKKRVLEYFTDGLELGLRPLSDNPADVVLAKLGEMYRFTATRRAMAEARARGLRKFVYIYEERPAGWREVDDPSSSVWKPPTVTVKEAFDAQIRAKTIELLESLGVPHERLVQIGGRRWGYAEQGTGRIVTKFGGPDFVIWHEMGHQLDWRYPELRKRLGATSPNSKLGKELAALADLRFEGEAAGPGFRRYVRKAEEKLANVFDAYLRAPEKFKQAAPQVWAEFKAFLAEHPELQMPLDEIRPSLKLKSGTAEMFLGGPVRLGSWMMPEGAAQVVSNYLQPGLGKFKTFRALREISGLMNGLQLAGFFHGQFVLNDSFYSGIGLALYDAMTGHPVRGAKELALTPVSPFTSLYRGHKIKAAIENPAEANAVYRQLAQLATAQNLRAGHGNFDPQFFRHWLRTSRELLQNPSLGAAGEWFLRTPFAGIELAMKPVMQALVPRMKLGIFARMAERVIADNPNADVVTLRKLLAEAADATEDRLGQVTYDNLFQARMAKDAGQLAFRAYGWQLTKYRMILGGAADWGRAAGAVVKLEKPQITFRMAYLPAMVVGHAFIGSLVQYLCTGRPPQSLKDYMFPETGLIDAYGKPVRVSIADFVKDLAADWRALRETFHGGGLPSPKPIAVEWSRKLGPFWNILAEMYRNEDFWGTQIFSGKEIGEPALNHLLQNFRELASHLATGLVPFSARASKRFQEAGGGKLGAAAPFLGLVPAPRAEMQTAAEARASEITRAERSTMTRQESEHARGISELVRDIRTGKVNNEGQFVAAARGKVRDQAELTRIRQRLLWTPLQYQVHTMKLRQAMEVFDLGTPQERVSLAIMMAEKIQRAYDGGKLDADRTRNYVRLVQPYYEQALRTQRK